MIREGLAVYIDDTDALDLVEGTRVQVPAQASGFRDPWGAVIR